MVLKIFSKEEVTEDFQFQYLPNFYSQVGFMTSI